MFDRGRFVKFAAKYNEGAHLPASQDPRLAPAVHFCTLVVGDICMEHVPQSKGQSLHADPPPPQPVLEAVHQGVAKALDLLHEKDPVFGDLREPNVLYLPEGGGRVLLVDFDAVGRDGMDRFSACLNPEAGLGVVRWQIVERAHNCENLKRLVGGLSCRMSRAW